MNVIINDLKAWQDLIGSILGGFFAFMVAYIVANQARKEERMRAGILILPNLMSYISSIERIFEITVRNKVSEDNKAAFAAEKFVFMRPTLSPMFESSMIYLMTLDLYLSSHLSLATTIIRDIDGPLKRYERDIDSVTIKNGNTRPHDMIKADAQIIFEGMGRIRKQAVAASYYIENLALKRYVFLYKIRRFFWKNKKEKEFIKLLETGEA